MAIRIAVAGAGIYGSLVAVRLGEAGHDVTLFDPRGVLRAASAINQYRVHRGYHYPRSPETIAEVLEAHDEFCAEFAEAIIDGTDHYYAIPFEGSRTDPDRYQQIMESAGLELVEVRPSWVDFDFIDRCWRVREAIYDSDRLRGMLSERLTTAGVRFEPSRFEPGMEAAFDFTVHATYGLSGSHQHLFPEAKFQVAEKVLIALPARLHQIALVVVDGPFTAFDPFGRGENSLFGSALHTNHWESLDPLQPIPARYAGILNRRDWEPVDFSRFEDMRRAAAQAVPLAAEARYLGSRFTLRVVERAAATDQRILHVARSAPNVVHLFSGKVVSAVKAARLVERMVAGDA
jgi:hypothetical protein